MKKVLATVLALLLIVVQVPLVVFADSDPTAEFSVIADCADGKVSRGDVITYTVSIGTVTNLTKVTGTYFFDVSDNLEIVEDDDTDFEAVNIAKTGVNTGNYGYPLMDVKKKDASDIVAKFRVKNDAVGEISVRFYAYELINQDGDSVTYTVNGTASNTQEPR